MKIKLLRKDCSIVADGKELKFVNGVCEVKKITKGIQFFIDKGYIQLTKEKKDGKADNK